MHPNGRCIFLGRITLDPAPLICLISQMNHMRNAGSEQIWTSYFCGNSLYHGYRSFKVISFANINSSTNSKKIYYFSQHTGHPNKRNRTGTTNAGKMFRHVISFHYFEFLDTTTVGSGYVNALFFPGINLSGRKFLTSWKCPLEAYN